MVLILDLDLYIKHMYYFVDFHVVELKLKMHLAKYVFVLLIRHGIFIHQYIMLK